MTSISSHNADWPATPQNPAAPDLPTREIDTHAIYHGWPGPDGQLAVLIESPPGNYQPLPHLIRHSPAGFNCGYDGNGPRDLALSLLIDALNAHVLDCGLAIERNDEDLKPDCSDLPVAPKVITVPSPDSYHSNCSHQRLPYLAFTEEIIAHVPKNEAWALSRENILRWVATKWPEIRLGTKDHFTV